MGKVTKVTYESRGHAAHSKTGVFFHYILFFGAEGPFAC